MKFGPGNVPLCAASIQVIGVTLVEHERPLLNGVGNAPMFFFLLIVRAVSH